MSESEKEKKIFLSYCGSRDQELLTGRKKMTLGDMERFSFLTEFFGLESYGLNLWKEFGDDVEEPSYEMNGNKKTIRGSMMMED